jgi:8-oxo-dGTP pyrophosphatase MutT (NUDIX family)
MKQELKQYLAQRQKRHIPDSGYMPAAVLIPLFCQNGQYHILFTRRTNDVSTHKGQISFPGGGYEPADGSLLATALRESTEEIGLMPDDAEILGELDESITTISNYVISSFVALIPCPYDFHINRKETAELIEVPVSHLLDKRYMQPQTEYKDGKPIDGYRYEYRGSIIWGATARIVKHFLDIWVEVVGNTGCQ